MKKEKTWILVADAGRARAILQFSPGGDMALVEGLDIEHPMQKTSDMVRDSLPRTFDSVGPGRHAITPRSDPHRAEKKNFAKKLAGILDTGLGTDAFDKLVIVAPPQMIGDLRPNLSEAVRNRLEREIPLDLAGAPLEEISRRLAKARAA